MTHGDWDPDISALGLSDIEKNGLQVYRNYNRSFSQAREKQFAQGVDAVPVDLSPLRDVLANVVKDDIRFVPIIACAFADEQLAQMFKQFLPDDIPGGKKGMLGRFGPISTLFNRIQFAFAFDMVHSDILLALDRLREHRNKLSHTWNPALLESFFKEPLPMMDELENALGSHPQKIKFSNDHGAETSLRLRTIWLLTRLFYEAKFYPLAKLAQVSPLNALYGEHHPKALGKMSMPGIEYTNKLFGK